MPFSNVLVIFLLKSVYMKIEIRKLPYAHRKSLFKAAEVLALVKRRKTLRSFADMHAFKIANSYNLSLQNL